MWSHESCLIFVDFVLTTGFFSFLIFFFRFPCCCCCYLSGIGEHWCPCLQFKDESVTSPHVIGGAQMAVKYINDIILNRTELLRTSCERIRLKKILKAETFQPNEKLRRFSSTNQDSDHGVNFGLPTEDSAHYRINFVTSPGNALFEVSVAIRNDKKVIVNPDISRTNVYGNQPKCILRRYPYARKFCYCKQTRRWGCLQFLSKKQNI